MQLSVEEISSIQITIGQDAQFKLISEDELMIINDGIIKEIKVERKYHPKK